MVRFHLNFSGRYKTQSSEEINQEIIASSPPIASMETSINFLSVEEINQELRKVRVELKVSSSIAMAIGDLE